MTFSKFTKTFLSATALCGLMASATVVTGLSSQTVAAQSKKRRQAEI